MSEALAILGYIVMGAAGLSLIAVIVGLPVALWRSMRQAERDDDIAEAIAALAEYDQYSAPEGGKPR